MESCYAPFLTNMGPLHGRVRIQKCFNVGIPKEVAPCELGFTDCNQRGVSLVPPAVPFERCPPPKDEK